MKSLGCWLDSKLKMDTYINKTCRAAFFHIYNIRKIRRFLNIVHARTLVNSFVTSRIDYCNSFLYGLPVSAIQKLQRLQNTAARLIYNARRFDHITPTLIILHWLAVKYRIDFKIITHEVVNGCAPAYLSEHFSLKSALKYSIR